LVFYAWIDCCHAGLLRLRDYHIVRPAPSDSVVAGDYRNILG
jgi:hypothetical protein